MSSEEVEAQRRGTPVPKAQPHAGIRGDGERGGPNVRQGRPNVPVPPPMDDRQAGVEARVRLKMSAGEPLTEEEKHFLATLPADRYVPPDEVQGER